MRNISYNPKAQNKIERAALARRLHLRPLPAPAWRVWAYDIAAALLLLAFMAAGFWSMGRVADVLQALGWTKP